MKHWLRCIRHDQCLPEGSYPSEPATLSEAHKGSACLLAASTRKHSKLGVKRRPRLSWWFAQAYLPYSKLALTNLSPNFDCF